MKLKSLIAKAPVKAVTAMPGKELGEDGEKRVLPKGTLIEHKGRKWELAAPVEVIEK